MLQKSPSLVKVFVRQPARSLNYLPQGDWDHVIATLTSDAGLSETREASLEVSRERGRHAAISFPPVLPGPGYELNLKYIKTKDGGASVVVGFYKQESLALSSGENMFSIDSAQIISNSLSVDTKNVIGIGPYISKIDNPEVSSEPISTVSNARDIIRSGDGGFYILDSGRIVHLYRDSKGRETTRTLVGTESSQGGAYVDGPGSMARFVDARHLLLAAPNRLYVSDAGAHAIRQVDIASSGQAVVSTLAGGRNVGAEDGLIEHSTFNKPSDLAMSSDGTLYVADTGNHSIRRIKLGVEGRVSTIAGSLTPGYVDGEAQDAQFNSPTSVAIDSDGSILVADSGNYRIRRIELQGVATPTVSTIAGSGLRARFQNTLQEDDGSVSVARLGVSMTVRVSQTGRIFVNDESMKEIADGQVRTLNLYGTVISDFARDVLSETSATGFCFDESENIFLAQGKVSELRFSEAALNIDGFINKADELSRPINGITMGPDSKYFESFSVGNDGYLYVTDRLAIYRVPLSQPSAALELIAGSPTSSGYQDGVGAQARFSSVSAMKLDHVSGDIFVIDKSNHVIRKITPPGNGSSSTVTTIAGIGQQPGYRDGPSDDALFDKPTELERSTNDNTIYFISESNSLIRAIVTDPETGLRTVKTVAGTAPTVRVGQIAPKIGYVDGPSDSALIRAIGLARVGQRLYFVDDRTRIRCVDLERAQVTTIAGAGKGASAVPIDGPGDSARFLDPNGMAASSDGKIVIGELRRLRQLEFDSLGRPFVKTLVGEAGSTLREGILKASGAMIGSPTYTDMEFDPGGDLIFHVESGSQYSFWKISSW